MTSRAQLRYALMVLVALAGCDEVRGAGDMAACLPNATGSAPHACGTLTCAGDEYCFFEAFGACAPPDLSAPDAGGPVPCGQYSCARLPSSCDCTALCGGPSGQPGPTGCLREVPACRYAVAGCFLRDSLIFCGDQ